MNDFIETLKTGIKVLLMFGSFFVFGGFCMVCGIYYGRFDMLVELEQSSEANGGAPILLYREDLTYNQEGE